MKMADKINYTNDTLKPTQIDTSALLMKDGAYSPTEIEQERQQQNQADNSLDAQAPQQQQPSGKLGDLFRDKTHLQNLIIISFLWVVASFDYFLINFQMKYIDGDMYINTIVSCVSEVIAYIVSGALYNIIGTKISFIGSFVLAIIGSIFYITLGDTYKSLIPVMILSAKFGISGAFNLVYLANTLFPPIYAATTFGIFNIFARLASMLAPQFAEFHKPLPMIIFCIMAGAALIVSLFIKKPKIQE